MLADARRCCCVELLPVEVVDRDIIASYCMQYARYKISLEISPRWSVHAFDFQLSNHVQINDLAIEVNT